MKTKLFTSYELIQFISITLVVVLIALVLIISLNHPGSWVGAARTSIF